MVELTAESNACDELLKFLIKAKVNNKLNHFGELVYVSACVS